MHDQKYEYDDLGIRNEHPAIEFGFNTMKQVLSFGAGVQSTALLLMSCKGILPKLDYAVFADTGWEPTKVYKHLEWCKIEAAKYGIPVVVVKGTKKGLRSDVVDNVTRVDGKRFAALPLFLLNKDGSKGMGMRQCTSNYKIYPVHKFLRREVLGLKPRQRAPKEVVIEQWMGISFDEATRAKESTNKWMKNVFPFLSWGCDYLDGKNWRRYQIINWLEENYPQIEVPRSACIGCPFHSNKEWRSIKENPEEWADAVAFDEAIRVDKRAKGVVSLQFLHRSGKPLSEVDLRSDEEKGQGSLWDNECEGMCGM